MTKQCPEQYCGGRLYVDFDRVVCILCGRAVKDVDTTTFASLRTTLPLASVGAVQQKREVR